MHQPGTPQPHLSIPIHEKMIIVVVDVVVDVDNDNDDNNDDNNNQ